MLDKRLLRPARRLPERFSWLDQRLARGDLLAAASGHCWALYLFLLAVADRYGLSYYGNHAVARALGCSPGELDQARQRLREMGLIAFETPFYQVLELPITPPAPPVVCDPPSAARPLPVVDRAAAQAQLRRIGEQLFGGAS